MSDNTSDNTMVTDALLRRWRLVLGQTAPPSGDPSQADFALSDQDKPMDQALEALYGDAASSKGGLGASQLSVPRWLGDIRRYFPSSVVQVMQQDAISRLDLKRLMLEPEMLQAMTPDVNLVATLLSFSHVLPSKTRDTARQVVQTVVDALMAKLREPLRSAVSGALNRSSRSRNPRHADIDWHRTIRANLKHYQAEYQTIIPALRIGYGRKQQRLRDVVLCIDQSGSMANSVVYASIFGAVLASIPALSTKLVVFDTQVVDLTEQLKDPVDLLFSVQLGGGTDINRAVAYCTSLLRHPSESTMVLISDLYEGGVEAELLQRAQALVASGVRLIVLLALSNEGAPSYDKNLALQLAALGVPSFACTPDAFADLMAAALQKADINAWAAARGIQMG
jgi:Mg-chelatase subunit ChlD